jgi:hypothetical protein
MIYICSISKYFSVVNGKHPTTIHFPGTVPKINYFNIILALNCDRCVNTGEPAAVLVFLIRIKVVEKIRPESAAAGHFFLFCHRLTQDIHRQVVGKGRRIESEKGRK